jgi:hypothetical protein
VRFHLAGGKANGKQIIAKAALDEEYVPNMVIPISAQGRALNPEMHLQSYGMGWFLNDYRGRGVMQHGGNIDGMSAMVALMPEEKTGLVILTNKNGTGLTTVVMNRVFDAFLGVAPRDWSADMLKAITAQIAQGQAAQKKMEAQRVANTKPTLSLGQYAGTLADSMYGDAVIKFENGKLHATLGKAFDGDLEHWHYDTFRANWQDRMAGKSMMTFALGADGKVSKLDVQGITTFNRRPPKVDTTAAVVLASSDLMKFAGTYANAQTKFSAEVQLISGSLRLTVPGQPPYTLVPDSPTKFRLTGPPGMPAGFFIEFTSTGERVSGASLTQPSPMPVMVLERK